MSTTTDVSNTTSSTNTTSIISKGLDRIIKYNHETGRLLDLIVFTTLSIFFRIFITVCQICIIYGFSFVIVFIPFFIITHSYLFLNFIYNGYVLK